ncbi:MAG TPA: glycosyltransferase [Thermoanaerobaculia bacterium]|nr:glycosyltransferase [Thermoanaerobaculia bacterium]
MKIALLTLTRGSVSGGFRKYLDRLVPLLRQQVERLDVFVPPQMARGDHLTWPERDELRGFRELRRSIAALQPDVVFIPTARVLRVGDVPVVTMVRNMEPLEVPFGGNTIVEGVKNVARAAVARAAARRSDRVIAVSNHVRDFLVERWKIRDERIGTVYHGIDPADERVDPVPEFAGRQFLFTAGSIRPARGLEDVITALAAAPRELQLAIGGTVDRGAEHYAAKMKRLASDLGVAPRITWTGQLDARQMAWFFRNAFAFVMTSRAEACPNTVLEAMANGAVSISTDHPPMPEFYADAAVYYRERDAADLARCINALAENERQRLSARARDRARDFTWAATARNTITELQRAVELAR